MSRYLTTFGLIGVLVLGVGLFTSRDTSTPVTVETVAPSDPFVPVVATSTEGELATTTDALPSVERATTSTPAAPPSVATPTSATKPTQTDSVTRPSPVVVTTTTPIVTTPPKPKPKPEPEPEPEPKPVVAPAPKPATSNLAWGVYSGYSAAELQTFEDLVGAEADMRGVFVNWSDPFPTSFGSSLKAEGKTMVIYWEQYGVELDTILAGETDDYIEEFAAAARAYGGPVILAPMHEMNGDWDPWGGAVGNNSPAKVVATWRHIVDTFGSVANVKFAWAVNNVSVPDTAANAIAKYYPGDAYVDYVAVDGFNFDDPWQTFDEVFGSVLPELSLYGKPVYILSMASADGPKKAEWIRDAFTVELPKYPYVRGWIWFNENKERDWRVNSDAASLEAFRESV